MKDDRWRKFKKILVHTENLQFGSLTKCIEAYIALLQGRSKEALQLAEHAAEHIGEPYSFMLGITGFSIALAKAVNNDIEGAISLFESTVEESIRLGNLLMAVMSLNYWGRMLVNAGELDAAEELYQRAIRLATDNNGTQKWISGTSYTGMGEIMLLRGDLESAMEYYREGLSKSSEWVDLLSINGRLGMARALAALNLFDDAYKEISLAEEIAGKFEVTLYDDRCVESQRKFLLIKAGRSEQAIQATVQAPFAGEKEIPSDGSYIESYVSFSEILIQARLHLIEREYEKCIHLAQQVAESTEPSRWLLQKLEAKLILMHAYWKRDSADQVMDLAEEILDYTSKRGIIQPVIDEGADMARILYKVRDMGCKHEYITILLTHFPLARRSEAAASGAGNNLSKDSLSNREIEVLTLLAQGLSNKEIAEKLYVSLRTVKWHTSNIYSKLGVRSRTRAVATARLLGIILD